MPAITFNGVCMYAEESSYTGRIRCGSRPRYIRAFYPETAAAAYSNGCGQFGRSGQHGSHVGVFVPPRVNTAAAAAGPGAVVEMGPLRMQFGGIRERWAP